MHLDHTFVRLDLDRWTLTCRFTMGGHLPERQPCRGEDGPEQPPVQLAPGIARAVSPLCARQ
jgi:hypothetical protein